MRRHGHAHQGELLLLDLDGTVVDIAPRPDAVVVEEGLKRALRILQLSDPDGLVIVTGRALADADRMLSPLRLPTMASHGAELRVDCRAGQTALPIERVRADLERAVQPFAGAVLEWKPFSAAVHVRSAPELAEAIRGALEWFVTAHRGYRIEHGRQVFEVLPADVSKACAVHWLLGLSPYDGRRPIYVGDDRADEAAMEIVTARGGVALRVAGEHFTEFASDFASPAHVRTWLAARAAGARRGTAAPELRCIDE